MQQKGGVPQRHARHDVGFSGRCLQVACLLGWNGRETLPQGPFGHNFHATRISLATMLGVPSVNISLTWVAKLWDFCWGHGRVGSRTGRPLRVFFGKSVCFLFRQPYWLVVYWNWRFELLEGWGAASNYTGLQTRGKGGFDLAPLVPRCSK